MSDYSKEEWNRLIAHYQQQFSSEYLKKGQSSSPATVPVSVASDPSTNETSTAEEATDIGSLQVRVSTLNNAFPIENAIVTVKTRNKNGSENLVRVMKTDNSGTTETIDLPTKNRDLSLSPGSDLPYIPYIIDVSADGYFRAHYDNVPIYGGVTAIQNAVMLPLPEGGDVDIPLSYTQNN